MTEREALQELAMRYAADNEARKTTRAALRAFRAERGFCDDDSDTRGCFRSARPVEQWCELCRESHPLWQAFRKAAKDRANSHRKLLRAALAAPPAEYRHVTGREDAIRQAVDRFASWPLPRTFAPDCGISFDGRKDDEWNKNKSWPTGTNLFTADEARAMFEHCLPTTLSHVEVVPPAPEPVIPAYRGYAALGTGQYVINHSAAGYPAELVITLATEADKAGRQIGESRDNQPDAPLIQADEMVIRIAFTSERGLFALEDQLAWIRRVHFPCPPAPEPTAAPVDDLGDDAAMIAFRAQYPSASRAKHIYLWTPFLVGWQECAAKARRDLAVPPSEVEKLRTILRAHDAGDSPDEVFTTQLEVWARAVCAHPPSKPTGATMAGGHRATITGGCGATMTGGDGATMCFQWYDGKRTRITVGYVGEDGIEANVAYRCDEAGKLVRHE